MVNSSVGSLSSKSRNVSQNDRFQSSPIVLYLKQLKALLWKSVIIRRVHYVSTFFEFVGPLIIPFVCAFIITMYHKNNLIEKIFRRHVSYMEATINESLFNITFDEKDLFDMRVDQKSLPVLYSPKSENVEKVISSLNLSARVFLIGVSSELVILDTFKKAIKQWGDSSDIDFPLMGISFDGNVNFNGSFSYRLFLPSNYQFKLNSEAAFFPKTREKGPAESFHPLYYRLIQVTAYINREYIKQCCKIHSSANINCDKFQDQKIEIWIMPYPSFTQVQNEMDIPDHILEKNALLVLLGYVLLCPLVVKRITDEKACKAKELLRMMGMSDFVFWSSHFVSYFVLIIFQAFVLAYLLFGIEYALLQYSSVSLFITFFLVFGAQMILFSMLLTTVFNRPVLGVIVSSILWIILCVVSYNLYQSKIANSASLNSAVQLLTSFLPTGSAVWFLTMMSQSEINKIGLHWFNINSIDGIYGEFTVLYVLLSSFFSLFLYSLLIFYLDNVWPFQPGVPKSPFFIFMPSFWKPSIAKVKGEIPKMNPQTFEPEPKRLSRKVQIQNVCKTFKNKQGKKFAVDHIWLNIYEKQLTVLLGHNGAGKSTTMNLITGMLAATSGSIYVNGYNVVTNTSQARRNIGLCPQENVVFDELTVGQHLKLFAMLKDFPASKVDQEINYVLDLLKLKSKKNALVSQLSGGMKRKLSLGIALIGDTEILILDEPTSGLDPNARRVIWDLLISIRRQRTILLTTHYMEEADVLADRIVIMNEGRLCCWGSPHFLKNAYSTGYCLRVAKLDGFNATKFVDVLKKYIPSTKLISQVETEVVFNLDDDKGRLLATFPKLFNDIEQNKQKYHVDSCGLSYTSLEDVFLSVGSDVNLSPNQDSEASTDNYNVSKLTLCTQSDLLSGTALFYSQLTGLFLKRFYFSLRYWPMLILQLVLPAVIIALAIYIFSPSNLNSGLELNPKNIYGKNITVFYHGDQQYFQDYEALNSKKYAATVLKVDSTGNGPHSVNKWLLERANDSLWHYENKFLYGLETYQEGTFKAWFNNEQLHSLPLSIIALYESLLRRVLPQNLKDQVNIGVTSIPLSIREDKHEDDTKIVKLFFKLFMIHILMLPIAFSILASSYVLFPIMENASKSKLMQIMTGLRPMVFWTVTYVFDLVLHLFTTFAFFVVIYLLDSEYILLGQDFKLALPMFLFLFAYGFSVIPLAYAFSLNFQSPSSGFTWFTIMNLIISVVISPVFITLYLLDAYNIFVAGLWFKPALHIARTIPLFSLLLGISKFSISATMYQMKCPKSEEMCKMLADSDKDSISALMRGCCIETCEKFCYHPESALKFYSSGSGIELLYLFLTGLTFLSLIILYESYKLTIIKTWYKVLSKFYRNKPTYNQTEISSDQLVVKEMARIDDEVTSGKSMTDLLTVHKLSKTFGQFTAVKGLSFGVHYNECFGLLGVNGAGKTTTFSMLTGELVPSSGNAYIKRGAISLNDVSNFQRNIGYCPQFDALLDKLTGRETLYLFARLRGVPTQLLKRDIETLVDMISLRGHIDKRTETYSGGTRRKLSIAIALIGTPRLIFLDEPSAGVDPAARRKMWQTLGYIQRKLNSSIVLTSHSMEECEALCSRIGIMVNGQFCCLGSTQQLRQKYGQGYSVTIRLKREHESDQLYVAKVTKEISKLIGSAVLKDYHQCLMHYHITDKKETWAKLFTVMNKLNKQFDFEDYVVSDTTLEQIFIMFARR